jgi:hypothetical protein
MTHESLCRSCGAPARLTVDADGVPQSVDWTHTATCERTVHEERRLRALAARHDPAARQHTPPQDAGR